LVQLPVIIACFWEGYLARSTGKESQRWPYAWVSGVDYPHRNERTDASGRIVLKDPQAPNARMTRLRVGLSYPGYTIQPVSRTGAPVSPRQIDWQTDAKHYSRGSFYI
jgi:rhamnogalacturonan endolyase